MADWFKNFFGFRRDQEGMSDPFRKNPRIDREDIFKDEFDSFFASPSPFAEASDMFRHVEEMFKQFESMFHGFDHEDFTLPSIESPEHYTEDKKSDNPRDNMLKIPDSNSSMDRRKDNLFGGWTEDSKMMDTDLDAEIAKKPLDKIIPEISPEIPRFNKRHSFNSSVFVKISGPDAKVEEHRTVKDSDGNVSVTVRRSLGDQTHVITTRSGSSGESEKKEELINMDEDGLKDFESKWQKQEHLPMLTDDDSSTGSPRDEVLKKNDSSYFNIIRRLFGRD